VQGRRRRECSACGVWGASFEAPPPEFRRSAKNWCLHLLIPFLAQELSRHHAIELLATHEGDVEMAVMSFLPG